MLTSVQGRVNHHQSPLSTVERHRSLSPSPHAITPPHGEPPPRQTLPDATPLLPSFSPRRPNASQPAVALSAAAPLRRPQAWWPRARSAASMGRSSNLATGSGRCCQAGGWFRPMKCSVFSNFWNPFFLLKFLEIHLSFYNSYKIK
jgi:hypothetical protein